MARPKKESAGEDYTGQFIEGLNKDLGEEFAFLVSDGSPSDVNLFVPTGSKLLDYVLTNREDGGWPVGKISECSGLEGTGKSLLAMTACANAQKMGGLVVYIDTENAVNTDFAQRIGLDLDNNFIWMCPTTVEDVFKSIFAIIHRLEDAEKKTKDLPYKFIFLVWDSVASTPTAKELNDENPDPQATMALKPRILSKNINNLIKMAGRKKVAFLFLNQLRMKIGAMPLEDPYITPGGKSIPYTASVRLRIQNKGKIVLKEDTVGIKVKAKCVKTRFCGPYRECEFPLYFTHGIDDWESIIDTLVETGDIRTKNGGVKGKLFSFKDEPEETGLNKVAFKKRIKGDETLRSKVLKKLADKMIINLKNPEEEEIEIIPLNAKEGEE